MRDLYFELSTDYSALCRQIVFYFITKKAKQYAQWIFNAANAFASLKFCFMLPNECSVSLAPASSTPFHRKDMINPKAFHTKQMATRVGRTFIKQCCTEQTRYIFLGKRGGERFPTRERVSRILNPV